MLAMVGGDPKNLEATIFAIHQDLIAVVYDGMGPQILTPCSFPIIANSFPATMDT